MSDEFDSLDAIEKAAVQAALYRCRALAAKIANELRNKRPEHFVDRLSLADIHASLERAGGALEQLSHQSVENAPDAVVKASQVRACVSVLSVFPRRYGSLGNPTRAPRDRAAPGALRFPGAAAR
jgi:crotonobetainyl-CoA:carnitine CoA-transferase CaiB-like acyl-CoA transferase